MEEYENAYLIVRDQYNRQKEDLDYKNDRIRDLTKKLANRDQIIDGLNAKLELSEKKLTDERATSDKLLQHNMDVIAQLNMEKADRHSDLNRFGAEIRELKEARQRDQGEFHRRVKEQEAYYTDQLKNMRASRDAIAENLRSCEAERHRYRAMYEKERMDLDNVCVNYTSGAKAKQVISKLKAKNNQLRQQKQRWKRQHDLKCQEVARLNRGAADRAREAEGLVALLAETERKVTQLQAEKEIAQNAREWWKKQCHRQWKLRHPTAPTDAAPKPSSTGVWVTKDQVNDTVKRVRDVHNMFADLEARVKLLESRLSPPGNTVLSWPR